jgi:hypothetical protein
MVTGFAPIRQISIIRSRLSPSFRSRTRCCTFPRRRGCSWVILGRLLPALLIWLSTSSQCLKAESLEQANGPPTPADPRSVQQLYGRDNLIAWCIVPFDSKKRGPEERAAMLQRLGFKHFAYDWRTEHIPTFDAEIEALKRHEVSLDAFWVAPGELNELKAAIRAGATYANVHTTPSYPEGEIRGQIRHGGGGHHH